MRADARALAARRAHRGEDDRKRVGVDTATGMGADADLFARPERTDQALAAAGEPRASFPPYRAPWGDFELLINAADLDAIVARVRSYGA